MHCPIDNETLVISERSGIEIDYCPKCRGVWLDRGELDKIIERSDQYNEPRQNQRQDTDLRREDTQRRDYSAHEPYKQHKKRESFLSDLFDF